MTAHNERRNMQRRNLVGILVLALVGTVAFAQVKEMPRTPVKTINQPSVVDINAAPEADIVSIGIEKTAAKKIIEGRPWRSKRDLLTKQVLTKEQYEKFKDSLVAKRPKKS
jgi:competence protein ComEA